jgi:hypothetical protein
MRAIRQAEVGAGRTIKERTVVLVGFAGLGFARYRKSKQAAYLAG